MTLSDYTTQIKTAESGAAGQNYDAGDLLNQVEKGQVYKEKYKSMSVYITNDLGMDHARGFRMMEVAKNFQRADAVAFGIDALDELRRIQVMAFPTRKPADMLAGQYTITDSDGLAHTLDFASDHRITTLRAFLALAEHAKAAPPASPEATRIAAALQGAAQGDPAIHCSVHDATKKDEVTLSLTAPRAKIAGVLQQAAAQL